MSSIEAGKVPMFEPGREPSAPDDADDNLLPVCAACGGSGCATCGESGNEPPKPPRWEGVVEVCRTCDRKAQWPFCEHWNSLDGDWYRLVRVREVGR